MRTATFPQGTAATTPVHPFRNLTGGEKTIRPIFDVLLYIGTFHHTIDVNLLEAFFHFSNQLGVGNGFRGKSGTTSVWVRTPSFIPFTRRSGSRIQRRTWVRIGAQDFIKPDPRPPHRRFGGRFLDPPVLPPPGVTDQGLVLPVQKDRGLTRQNRHYNRSPLGLQAYFIDGQNMIFQCFRPSFVGPEPSQRRSLQKWSAPGEYTR